MGAKINLPLQGRVGEVYGDLHRFLAYVDGKVAEKDCTQDIAAEVERIKSTMKRGWNI